MTDNEIAVLQRFRKLNQIDQRRINRVVDEYLTAYDPETSETPDDGKVVPFNGRRP